MLHKLLIVEDDDATREGLRTLFSSAGYFVIAVATVPAGAQALRNEAPDLLIADVRVNGYNGLQLATMREAARVPAIFITGFSDPVLEADARRIGAEFLYKPILPGRLLALVKEKLTRATSEGATPTRRWPRTSVKGGLAAHVGASHGRIVNVSYGGLRVEVEPPPAHMLPASFSVAVPASGVEVEVDLVWQQVGAGEQWVCGLEVSREHQAAWRQLVDAVSY